MHVCGFVCGFACVCVRVCVRKFVRITIKNWILVVQIPYLRNTVFLYSIQAKSRCSSWHCRLYSYPVWENNLADFFQPQLQGRKKRTKKSTSVCCLTWIRMVCYWVKSCLTMSCLAEWAAVRSGPPSTLIYQVATWLRVDCDTQSLCDDAVETWSWYPTVELLWSHCTLWNRIPCQAMTWVQAYCRQKKSMCMLWDFWTTYVMDYFKIYMFFANCVT